MLKNSSGPLNLKLTCPGLFFPTDLDIRLTVSFHCSVIKAAFYLVYPLEAHHVILTRQRKAGEKQSKKATKTYLPQNNNNNKNYTKQRRNIVQLLQSFIFFVMISTNLTLTIFVHFISHQYDQWLFNASKSLLLGQFNPVWYIV